MKPNETFSRRCATGAIVVGALTGIAAWSWSPHWPEPIQGLLFAGIFTGAAVMCGLAALAALYEEPRE